MRTRRIVRAGSFGDVRPFAAPVVRLGHDSLERMNDTRCEASVAARAATKIVRAGDESPERMKAIGPAQLFCVRVAIDLGAIRESLKSKEDDSPKRMTAATRARAGACR